MPAWNTVHITVRLRLVGTGHPLGPDIVDRRGQPPHTLVDDLGGDRGVRQTQRMLAALEQEVAALDYRDAPVGRKPSPTHAAWRMRWAFRITLWMKRTSSSDS